MDACAKTALMNNIKISTVVALALEMKILQISKPIIGVDFDGFT